ncbi:MAG: hypothetical protein ACFCUQ_01755 [Kiloniellales bacterium]
MFGFSLQKILVLIAIVAAVWYGFKFLSRLDATRKAEAKLRERMGGKPSGHKASGHKASGGRAAKRDEQADAEDMVLCPVCQSYVPARGSSNCGRPDCPY